MRLSHRSPSSIVGMLALITLTTGSSRAVYNTSAVPHLMSSSSDASSQQVAWLNIPPPPPPADSHPATSRPTPLCLLTPGRSGEVWSDRPLFMWAEKFLEPGIKGNVDHVTVIVPSSQVTAWSQTIPEASHSSSTGISTPSLWTFGQARYTGEALHPNQTYEWVVLDGFNRQLNSGSFQVMAAEEREAIMTDLAVLEEQLTARGKTSEAIAFEKTKYFAERQLWSDALQVAFSVENPSSSLVEFRNQTIAQLCDAP